MTAGKSKRGTRFWVSAWLPVLLAMCVIAAESTPYFGADHTSAPFRWIYEHLFGRVSDWDWGGIHHYIRKTGHFIGYGCIGVAWLRAWRMTFPKFNFFQSAALAMLGTAMIASADEFHQTFLPNRTGLASDVVLDCCGALVLQLIAYFVMRAMRPSTVQAA